VPGECYLRKLGHRVIPITLPVDRARKIWSAAIRRVLRCTTMIA
jgi:hypothetical protein